MRQFYLVINHGKLYVLRRVRDRFEFEYFDGDPCFTYGINRVKEAIDTLMKMLIDNHNLEDESELSFIVLASGDAALDSAFGHALGARMAQEIKIEGLLERATDILSHDPANLVNEFGINYDNRSYHMIKNKLRPSRFSLYACTLSPAYLLDILAESQKGEFQNGYTA